ncbi:MAG TPA: hypothetical protein VII29_02035 [Terriglobales bacterium]|jgi:hypothetical protein
MPVALPTTVYLGTHFQLNLADAIAGPNYSEARNQMAAATDTEGGIAMKQSPFAQDQ